MAARRSAARRSMARPSMARRSTAMLALLATIPMLTTGVVVGSPVVAVTGSVLAVVGLVEWRRHRGRRVVAARAAALPLAVDHLLHQLRSGASLRQACRGVEAELLQPLVIALERGATLVDAARVLGAGPVDPSVRLVATTLEVLAANGGPAVPALQRLRHTLVGRAHRRHRAEAQAASALASAALLALAPALFALVLSGVEPTLARFYLREPLGAVCATASVLLSLAGWLWIQRSIVRAAGGAS